MPVKPIPDGYHSVTPYVVVQAAAKLIDFMKQAFDAQEIERMQQPDGVIMHAEVKIGDSIIMLSDARGDFKPMPCAMYLYVNDTDAIYKRALLAGATSIMEPANKFYGDRNAGVIDPSDNMWWIATHVEDVSPDELMRRAQTQHKE